MTSTVRPSSPEQASTHREWAAAAAERACGRLAVLALETETRGMINRPFMGGAMLRAMALVEGWMREAGLDVRRDGFGNVVGRLEGLSHETILTGSHLDTVPDAGAYDGQLGIVAAIESAARLRQRGPLARSLEVVAFSEEEGVRFGFPFIGSKGFFGRLAEQDLERTDTEGISIREALAAGGCDGKSPGRGPYPYFAYHEVHLEQGPVLESLGRPIGIVMGIAGQIRLAVIVTGEAGHAGTTPMDMRHDALATAARMVLAVREVGNRAVGLVATVGQMRVSPNAVNVIPGQVEFTVDIRHAEREVLETAMEHLQTALVRIAGEEQVRLILREISRQAPVPCDALLMSVQAARMVGAPILVSGAGHDALAIQDQVPVSMTFVRCRGGLSHHPDEFVSPADIEHTLAETTAFLSDLLSQPQVNGEPSNP